MPRLQIDPEWWKSFFNGVVIDFWLAAVDELRTAAEAAFIQAALRLPAGAKVLDAPCGAGRIALELAAAGFQMTGIDITSPFLDLARESAAKRKLAIQWEQRDMRDLGRAAAFDGAVCWGGSFGYFDDPGNAQFLRALAAALKPGGRLLLDACKVAELILPHYEERTWMQAGDIHFLEQNHYDHVNSRLQTQYTFIRDGNVETRAGSERIYTFKEFHELFGSVGLRPTAAYGTLNRDPFIWGAPALYLVAEK